MLTRLQILRRVIRQWAIAPQRVFQRIPSHSLVEIALGLPAVMLHLNGGEWLRIPEETGGQSRVTFTTADWLAANESQISGLSGWQIINESPGGFAVRAVSVPEEQVRAGDIVALRAQSGMTWMVASVRWLQMNDDDEIEMGLQVLSAKAVPALIRSAMPGEESPYLPAVLLPVISTLNQPARIAASKGTYIPMRELSVLTPTGVQKVRALKLVEQQMSYDLFDYQIDGG